MARHWVTEGLPRSLNESGRVRHDMWCRQPYPAGYASRLFAQWLRWRTGCSAGTAEAFLTTLPPGERDDLDAIVRHLNGAAALAPYKRGRPPRARRLAPAP